MTEDARDVCWFCGGKLCWDADYDYRDIYWEGDGVVAMLHCKDCGAEVQYSLREDEEQEE
jgi:hypothetical protein